MFSRREFLGTSTLISLAPTVPEFLKRTAQAAGPARDTRILVVIELNGGNDGINTVVPFTDEGYAKYRRELRLPTNRVHKINREVGLHPAMTDAAKLLEGGRLAIVQGVGYPNPSRSHFQSMAIWHSANVTPTRGNSANVDTRAAYGWIGQSLDEGRKPADGSPAAQFIGAGEMPTALRSRRSVASSITQPEDSVLALKACIPDAMERKDATDLATFLHHRMREASSTSQRMAAVLRAADSGAIYPATSLAGRLKLIGQLIKGGGGTRVYYTTQNGYDTHYFQRQLHAKLLGEFSSALAAFLNDMKQARLADRVLVLSFSEFGRRVQENDSKGTDHGTAGPVFLAGPKLKPGLIGEAPKLLDLQEGDLKVTTDFRRVYASVLEDWLGLPAKPALGARFEKLSLFQA